MGWLTVFIYAPADADQCRADADRLNADARRGTSHNQYAYRARIYPGQRPRLQRRLLSP